MEITVDNIKCGGCAGSITKKLTATFGTDKINVNIEKGIININLDNSKKRRAVQSIARFGLPGNRLSTWL